MTLRSDVKIWSIGFGDPKSFKLEADDENVASIFERPKVFPRIWGEWESAIKMTGTNFCCVTIRLAKTGNLFSIA